MITIRALLDRIRWDMDFSRGEFAIGYYDRLEQRIIVLHLGEVQFDQQDHEVIQLISPAGQALHLPLHRICELYRDGQLIWHRDRCHCVTHPGQNMRLRRTGHASGTKTRNSCLRHR